jgi:hypothetical protein
MNNDFKRRKSYVKYVPADPDPDPHSVPDADECSHPLEAQLIDSIDDDGHTVPDQYDGIHPIMQK